jgi:hypothetical protein
MDGNCKGKLDGGRVIGENSVKHGNSVQEPGVACSVGAA